MKHLKFLLLIFIGILSSCVFTDQRSLRVDTVLDSMESGDTVSSLVWGVRVYADSITKRELKRATVSKVVDSIYHSNLDTEMNGFKANSKLATEFKNYLKVNYPDYYVTYSRYQYSKKYKSGESDNHW